MFKEIRLIKEKDPSVKTFFEALLHPCFKIKIYYKISHFLYNIKLYYLSRLVSNIGKKKTGIEIHPGAKIGKNLFIDHGMGIVIGETSIIGNNVTIYHGVTLGGVGFSKKKRHPTIEDNVLLGCGSTILGDITVGCNSKVGAGAVVVKDVKSNTTVIGIPAREVIMKINIKKLLFYILITIFIGSIPTFFIKISDIYKYLNKPPLSPPGFIFPVVWTSLFILMGISIYRVVSKGFNETYNVQVLYFIQLFINALWTPIFFGLNAYLFAFIWLLILFAIVIVMDIKFYHIDKISSYLLIPYIIWLVFAGYLTFGVYILN